MQLGQLAADCEAAGMRISTPKSEAMLGKGVLSRTVGELLHQVEESHIIDFFLCQECTMDKAG